MSRSYETATDTSGSFTDMASHHKRVSSTSRTPLRDVYSYNRYSPSAEEQAIKSILDDLSYAGMSDRGDALCQPMDGTFTWAALETDTELKYRAPTKEKKLTDLSFAAWCKEKEGDLYCFMGKPGSGKSTLIKYLASDPTIETLLQAWVGDKMLIRAEHYFWILGRPVQKSREGLLRHLLYSSLRSLSQSVNEERLREYVENVCGSRWDDLYARSTWTHEELHGMLVRLLSRKDLKFLFLIDALDECEPESSLPEIAQELLGIAHFSNVKVCVSCRPWNIFLRSFGNASHTRIEPSMCSDMKYYIKSRLSVAEAEADLNDDIRNGGHTVTRLVAQVTHAAHGVFLWAVLIVNHLCSEIRKGRGIEQIQSVLTEMPVNFDSYVEVLIFNRTSTRQNMAKKAVALMLALRVTERSDKTTGKLLRPHSFVNFWLLQSGRLDHEPSWTEYDDDWYTAIDAKDMVDQTAKFLDETCRDLLVLVDRRSMSQSGSELDWDVEFFHPSLHDLLYDGSMGLLIKRNSPDHFRDEQFLVNLDKLRCVCLLHEVPAAIPCDTSEFDDIVNYLGPADQPWLKTCKGLIALRNGKPHQGMTEASLNNSDTRSQGQDIRAIQSDSGYASAKHKMRRLDSICDEDEIEDDESDDDRATQYSEAASIGLNEREGLVINVIECLIADLPDLFTSHEGVKEFIDVSLPQLLKTFALRLGFGTDHHDLLNVMYFVSRRKEDIKHALLEKIDRDTILDGTTGPPADDSIPGMQVDAWIQGIEDPDPADHVSIGYNEMAISNYLNDEVSESSTESERAEMTVENNSTFRYRDLVMDTWSYKWLIATMRSRFLLQSSPNDVQSTTGDYVRANLYRFAHLRRLNRHRKPAACKACFQMDWDLFGFLTQQEYDCGAIHAIMAAVVVTGSAKNAQACTCLQYMRQTWPMSGEALLAFLQTALQSPGQDHDTSLPDGTIINVTLSSAMFIVSGTVEAVAETAEQLCWLGSALRPSNLAVGLATCVPSIQISEPHGLGTHGTPQLDAQFRIRFDLTDVEHEQSETGFCWSSMFRNTILVQSYPILRRKCPDTGLEANLDVLAKLVRAKSLEPFNERLYVKGFSSMLVATGVKDEFVHWHHVYNDLGESLSYLDIDRADTAAVSWTQLDQKRHIVGWSPEITCHAGAREANLDIAPSRLPKPHAGLALEKATISGGKYVTAGATVGVGVRDTPCHLPETDTYDGKLRRLSGHYVVLWDESTKRGWLVNGPTALLYLVRSYLHHEKGYSSADQFLFDPAAVQTPAETYHANSAHVVLQNTDNRWLRVYDPKTKPQRAAESYAARPSSTKLDGRNDYIRFEDRADIMYEILMKIQAWQEDKLGENGIKFKCRMRVHLEGWDFSEITRNQLQTLHPKVATLQAIGLGWVDFIRSINAVVLLGKGFGDLIQATQHHGCRRWAQLPRDRYYLAASMTDMEAIIDTYGDPDSQPPRVCGDLFWYKRGDMFAKCKSHGKHADLVQVLWPRSIKPARSIWRRMFQSDEHLHLGKLPANGGVAFGHPVQFPYSWPNDGDPVETLEPLPVGDHTLEDIDSALGRSISSPGATDPIGGSQITSTTSEGAEEPRPHLPDTRAGANDEADDCERQGNVRTSTEAETPTPREQIIGRTNDEATKQGFKAGVKSWARRVMLRVRNRS